MKTINNTTELLGDDLKEILQRGSKLRIAAATFSIYAYEALRKELSEVEELQFIFTSNSFVPQQANDRAKKERRQFHIPTSPPENDLYGTEFEIRLRNQLTQRAIAQECANWIRKKARFRANEGGRAIQPVIGVSSATGDSAYSNIQGFSTVDLGYEKGNANPSVVIRIDENENASQFIETFKQLWADTSQLTDVTDAVCDHIESVYQENSPERLYFAILYNIFHEFLEEVDQDSLPNDRLGFRETKVWNKLFNFQKDAVTGIINKLETYNGCILADSVGLGKTFTALAVIKYYELRNQRVLVLCPKKLGDNWRTYNSNLTTNLFSEDRFSFDVLFHTDLSRTSGESNGMPLDRVNWGNYDLVVIDESHNFRNNDALKDRETRYQRLMNKVIRAGVKTRVLMLSATPVNNRFLDLKNQLALAYEGNSENLSGKLKTQSDVDAIFRQAQAAFNLWSKLPPHQRTTEAILNALDFDFFELLDAVTIARSRRHIETFYDTSDIGKFPTRRKPLSYRQPITTRADIQGLNAIVENLGLLKLSIYAPLSYVFPSRIAKYEALYDTQVGSGGTKLRQTDREKSLVGLMTTNLLKRLESSVWSFRLTLNAILQKMDVTLAAITNFEEQRANPITSPFGDLDDDESPDAFDDDDLDGLREFTVGKKIEVQLADMDLISWRASLENDRKILLSLAQELALVTPEHDAKLQHLVEIIREKVQNPINTGNQKVIVFTAFADTAEYLYEHLAPIAQSMGLHAAVITGSRPPRTTLGKKAEFNKVLTLFSPRSRDKELIYPGERHEIDLLIGTDCISEGQNLQDCDFLINYDIHWNPVRIIQRFGRIDRIGSQNDEIQLVNYWPDISLDEYINLKERVENRMVITDLSATADDNVLGANSTEISYRKEQLERLQNEVIELEDLKTGISIMDLGLNEFRMDLLSFIKENKDIAKTPKGIHAIVPAQPSRGLYPGVIYVLRNLNEGVQVSHQNRLHPHYLVYIGQDGTILANHTEVKRLLDLIRVSTKGLSEALRPLCEQFNRETADGRDMAHYSTLLSQSIRSMIEVKEEKDIDSLFSGTTTTALTDTIRGLDDFELVAFLVIQEARP